MSRLLWAQIAHFRCENYSSAMVLIDGGCLNFVISHFERSSFNMVLGDNEFSRIKQESTAIVD